MSIKVAINGFGRIGRLTARAMLSNYKNYGIELVAINDLTDVVTNAHLLKYDSVHDKFKVDSIKVEGNDIVADGKKIHVFAEKDPSKLPWASLGVDVVFECTGKFTTKEKANAHLQAGAKKVLISAPGEEVDATIVFGVNHGDLKASYTVVSNASCTTNCLAPLAKPLQEEIGIVNGLMTTIHSYTNDQCLTDVFHKDLRRARSATQSIIPTKTGAAKAVGLVLPALAGKLNGFALRVPTINVSVVDLTFLAARDTTKEEIKAIMKKASEGELKGILGYNEEPLVSIDFNHDSRSSVFEASYVQVIGRTVKVLSWYDNEWAFSLRMLDTAMAMMKAK